MFHVEHTYFQWFKQSIFVYCKFISIYYLMINSDLSKSSLVETNLFYVFSIFQLPEI